MATLMICQCKGRGTASPKVGSCLVLVNVPCHRGQSADDGVPPGRGSTVIRILYRATFERVAGIVINTA